MRALVLGSAAGGGFPQWNCGCPNCEAVRRGDPRLAPRTQDSIAVTAGEAGGEGVGWALLNASPDIAQQVQANRAMHPRARRDSPIASIVLANGDLDHTLGLFSLRESWPLVLYATDAVRQGLEERNAIFRTLRRFPTQVTWRRLELGRAVALEGTGGLTVEARPLPGKLPVHLVGLAPPSDAGEENVGLWVRDPARGTLLVYATAVSKVEGLLGPAAGSEGADALFLDGTFWSSDELVAQGLSKARAEDMAHAPIGGEGGSLAALVGLNARRRIYTHINNSNPILREGSPEHRAVVEAGWEIAHDGMEISL
jgi:pyrroloquinoline quinone biosynthesis protein B